MEQSIKQRIVDIRRGNVPAGYQKTKFGIIPADWNEVPLDSILQNVVRKVPKPQAAYWRLGVRSHAKGTFRELVDDPATVNMDELYSVRANDLVVNITFAWEHAIAIVNENDSGLLVSHRFPTYTFRNNASPDFYRYVVTQKWMKEQLDLISPGGAGRNRVMNKNLFLKISCYLPPLEEQRRIADILGCCDRVITLKKELIAEKKKQKKALMQKLLNPDSGFRLPGFSGKWKSCNLGCFGECIRGVSYQPSEDLRNNYSNETYTLLRANNFGQSELNMSEVFFVDKKCVSSEQEIISGDILISMSSGSKKAVGKITLITNIAPKTCVGAFCAIFRSKNSNFLKHFFETRDYQQQLSLLLEGTNINNLTPQEIENLKVNIPDNLKEQQAIADILSAADKEIDLLEQELAQQEQKKKSLMQLLLTGIVRV